MSLRLALVFALFMCVSAVSAANVQHIATYYDIDEAHTVFSYNITTDVDISYWMLGLDCGSVPPLANADINEFWRHFQQDPFSTDNYGYLWDMGQGAGTSKVYSIALNGMVQQGSVTYTLGGSGNNADVEIIGAGPACSGGDYPTEGCPADIIDPRLPCDEFVAEDGDVFHSDHCDDSFSVDRTHVIIDGDFESHCTQEIKVSDEKAPDFYPPADFEETIHIQCGDPIPPVPAMYANDTCDGTVADQELHLCDEIDEGDCPGHFFLTRTWTAVDRCGNSKCLTQTIVVEDNTPPVLEGVPDHQTIPCGETIPDPDSFPWPTVTATDSCNNCSAPAVQRKQEIISLCGDTYQLKRTFWAVDCCGNKAEESYYITIQDNGKPTIELLEPANNTVYCPDTPRPPKARAIDACGDVVLDDDLVPTVVDLSDGSLCEGQQLFKYVWTITDPCGNIDTHEEIIHVVDVNEPEFVHFPADAQYECGDEIPFEQATCYDECLGRQFDATYVDHLFDGECLDVIIREWTCTDACGNPFSRNQTISEFDNTPPEVDESTLPPNLTFSCKSEADEYFNSEEADLEIYLEPEITSVCQVKAAYKDNQDPRCTTNAADGHVVWLKGFPGGDRFIGAHEAGIYANTDPLLLEKDESTPGNFRVFMKGTVVQVGQLDRLWDVELEFTDHVPAGQKPCEGGLAIPDSGPAFCWGPKKELGNYNLPSNDVNSCYCPGCPADADAFEYYSHYRKLSLYGRGVLEGAHIEMRMRGPPSMWGFGGSNKNTHYGASFWLDWRVVSKSTGHSFMTNTNFPQDWSYGDFNFDIDGCEEDLVICPNDYTMFEHPHIIPGRCVNDYTIERTFQFIDCAGNDANATRWVNVNDTEAPTLHNVPADQRILCNETFTPNPAITATDNCDTQVGVSDEIIDTTTTGCDDVYTEHHKVTACDVCNNCAVDFYDVEYYDDVKPVFTFVPQDEEVECADYDDFTLDTPTAEDNCGQPSVTGPFIHHLGGECHHRRAEEWEYTATDDCGNVKKVNVTVTLIDNDKPLLTGLPDRELNVTCGNVPCPPKVTATDNCHGVDIDFVETSDVKDVCEDNIVEVITRTWTATDACDQETVFVQTIYVRDDTPPTVPDGYEYHVRCDNITEPTLPEITDDCDEDVTCELHKHIDQSYNPTCLQEYAHHFDWECVDNCGNVAWYNVTMFVDDDYKPTLSLPNGLENGTYNECDLKYLDPVAITSAIVCDDSCGECSAHLVDIETQIDEECPSEKYQILTFEGCDDCNNCDDLVFVQSSNDTKPPVLDQVDDTITYPCTAGTAPNVEAQDDCDDSVSVSYDGADESTCNVSYNRTWTAIDVCGNAAQRRQLVTVVDTEAPQFDFPEDWKETDTITTCHCLPSPPELTAYDACEGEIDVVRTRTPEQDPNNSCGWTVTWDFTATDSCGQVNSTQVVWTIVDNDAPLFTPPSHVDVTASCKLPNVDSPAAYDLCNSHTLVNESYREDGKGAHCFDYHVRWNATDDCGNSDVWGYTINVKDVTGPIVNFSFVPPHTDSQECTLPEAPTYTISDNCDPNPVINYTNPVNTECPYRQTETRTWSWSDDCGNGMSRTSVVSSTYEGPAEFQNLPSNSTLTCQKPPLPSLKAKDSCGGMYDAELISNIETPICPGSWHVERTWKVVDVCSEVNYYTQIRDSVDNTPPSHTSTLGDETRDFYHNGVCGIRAQPDISITDSCSNVNSSKTQTPAYPGCAYEPVVTEAWNAHDECGNDMDEFSREVTYTFEHDPIFHTSGDKRMEISCNDTLPVLIVTATDVCGNTVPVTGPVDTIKGQTCNNNYIVVRTWTATDDCGNTKDFVKEIRVKDDFDPVLIGVPADVNVECGCEPEPATVSAKDNCEGVNVTLREWRENEDPNNCCIFEIVREWTATDDCGRNVTGVQRITVRDKTPPRLTNVPADLCLNCTDDIPEPNVGAEEIEKALGFCVLSDNGASDCWPDYLTEPPVPHPSVIIGGVEYFPINDVHIIKYLKENRTLFYGQFGYNGGGAKIEINLENGVPKPVFDEDDNCFFGLKPECASLVNTDTWTVYPTITGTLTLDDGTEVSISGASNDVATLGAGVTGLNVHMGLRIPLADGVVNVALAQDQVGNCDLSHIDIPELSCDHEFEVDYNDTWSGDSCVNITDRLFWACDESNNCAYARQRITIKDQGNPWFINVPTGGDIDCNSAIPTAEEEYPDIADDCQEPTLDHEDDESGDICSGYTLTRTWYVSDGCGNTDSDETVYTQSDKEDPVLTVDEHETVGNCSYVPPYPTWSASDDCDEDLATEGWKQRRVDVIPGVVSCPNNYNLIRSLEVADDCGKTDDFEYTVVVRDTTAPTFNEEPGSLDENLSCEDELPTAAPTCSDECGESVTPTVLSEGWTHNGTCSATYVRTWECKDACSNSDTFSAIYIFTDGEDPVLVSGPSDFTKNCSDPTEPEAPVYRDTCSEVTVELIGTESLDPNPTECEPNTKVLDRVLYTWSVTDECNNHLTYTVTVTIVDEIAPSLENVPEDERFNCTEDVPCPDQVCASDNCNGIWLDFEETSSGVEGCGFEIVRTWTATDRCGNTAIDSQNIVVNDTVAPVFDGEDPTSNTVYCADWDGVEPEMATATDNCGTAHVTKHHSFAAGCGETGVWTWKFVAVDDCGNKAVRTWTTTITDAVGPDMVAPADEYYNCTHPGLTAGTYTDDCDTDVYVTTHEDPSYGKCDQEYNITVTYTGCDDCNNCNSTSYNIFVSDEFKPVWTSELPADVTVNCTDVPPSVNLTAHDDCDGDFEVVPVESIDARQCFTFITRTWTVSDECGNSIQHVQTITVTDEVKPYFTSVPDDQTVQCDNVVFVGEPTYDDNCDDDLSSHSYTNNNTDNECAVVVTRHWIIADDCGNEETASADVTVIDTTNPDLGLCDCSAEPDCVYCDQEFTCSDETNFILPANFPFPTSATDNCAVPDVTHGDEFEGHGCIERFSYHYWIKADDGCGNVDYRNFTYKVWDDEAPVFIRELDDVTVECDDLDTLGNLTLDDTEDNCGNAPAASIEGGELGNEPATCQNYTFTRTWIIKDDCGNTNTSDQVVTVYDGTAPTFDSDPVVPFNVSCEDVANYVQPDLDASDNCGEATVTKREYFDHDDGDECANSYTVFWEWTATDECGHTTVLTRSFPVYDDTDPAFDVPANATVECDNIPCPETVTATDNCAGLSLSMTENIVGPICEQVIERTYTATDDCDNTYSKTQYLTVEDSTKPLLSSIPPKELVFECQEEPMENLTATDNCDDDITVVQTHKITPGGCAANYTIFREWVATDECGNVNSTTQNVTVHDSIPPTVTDGDIVCQRPNLYHSWVVVPEISVPNHFFGAADACSEIQIHIRSCRSNQDESWFLDLDENYNFTRDCDYFSSNDTLVIFPRLLPGVLEGRKFVVEADVEDACGHVTPVSREIYVPYNNDSPSHAPPGWLPDDFDIVEDCEPIPTECPGDCVCEYNEPLCPEGGLAVNFAHVSTVYDEVADETTFSYALTSSSASNKRLTLGLDLSKVEVVRVSPDTDVLFGAIRDSYVSGITWGSLNGVGAIPVSVTLKGEVQTGVSTYQIADLQFKNAPCTSGQTLSSLGIDEDSVTYGAGDVVEGQVFVNAYLGGDTNDLLLPVPGVIVELVTVDDLLRKTVLRTTSTDVNGHYAFHNVVASGKKIVIAADGFLRDASDEFSVVSRGLSGDFFSGESIDLSGLYPFGLPVKALVGSSNDLHLLIDPNAEVAYERDHDLDGITIEPAPVPRDPLSFNGNSKSKAFWKFQLGNYAAKTKFSSAEAAAIVSRADLFLQRAGCSPGYVTLARLSSGTPFEQALLQAALNFEAGFGVFDPFRTASEFFILSAAQVECFASTSATAGDRAIAQGLLERVNQAS